MQKQVRKTTDLLSGAALAILCVFTAHVLHAAAKRPLKPFDAIETTRVMDDPVSVSPNGRRFATRLLHGDIASNGLWLEIVSGGLDSLEAAAKAKVVTKLFGNGLGSDDYMVGPDVDTLRGILSPLSWIDSENVAFIWSDENGCRQVVALNLLNGQVRWLTRSDSQIVGFAIHPNGTLIYNAQVKVPRSKLADLTGEGLVLPYDLDGLEVLQDDINLGNTTLDKVYSSRWYSVVNGAPARHIVLANQEIDRALPYLRTLLLSSDGRQAIVAAPPQELPADWDRYTYDGQPFMKNVVSALRRDRRSSDARRAIELNVVDLKRGTSRPLWAAIFPVGVVLKDSSWSPDGQRLLLAPTFLPVSSGDTAGLAGSAAAVVEVASGRYNKLPIELKDLDVQSYRWVGEDTIVIDTLAEGAVEQSRHFFWHSPQGWVRRSEPKRASAEKFPSVVIEVRQDLNTPPTLHAIHRKSGKDLAIFNPNPRLTSDYALGRVEKIDGTLAKGLRYSALVFYPANYQRGTRYPLVLHPMRGGIDPKEFTLYGWQDGGGLGPAPIASFAAQTFANRGMMTAFVNVSGQPDYEGEAKARQLALDNFAEKMIVEGVADRNKIGLNGFSRTGYYVVYAATHSQFPYAAALANDNIDGSYMQSATVGWDASYDVNGGPAFGTTLQYWLAEAPGFNAERVRLPLALISQSGGSRSGIWAHWEMFSRLRSLHRPVELYLMPGIDTHPSHNPQNPRQILAVQEYAVDWFDFWLNGHENQMAEKVAQYERWRKLRMFYQAATER